MTKDNILEIIQESFKRGEKYGKMADRILVAINSDRKEDGLIFALEKLARLGNGAEYGNSYSNIIAKEALDRYRGQL